MRLSQAFAIRNKEVVSFVGGGGKTSAMFRLAEELVEQGKRVVTTTTTRIFAAQIKLAPHHIRAESEDQALRDLESALKVHPSVLVIGPTTEEGKAFGVSPTLVDRIVEMDLVDVVLNEADGSRMRPFKAPGDHEPVVPLSTTLLVPVAGVDALGAPLDQGHVHRPELVADLAGAEPGSTVEPWLIARVLESNQGGLKNRPPHARVTPLINKVENVAQLLSAREIARELLDNALIEAVLVGAVKNAANPVAECQRRVAAVVLAAGGSSRMKGPLKQLLPWGPSTLIGHTIDVVRQSQVSEVVLVVGRDAEAVVRETRAMPAKVAHNPDWQEGRSTSVRAGTLAVQPNAAAVIFVNADQPFLTSHVIDKILQRYFQTLAPIVVPVYGGRTGSPVLFAREMFGELVELHGDDGGKRLLESHSSEVEKVNIVDLRAAIDLDTMVQYEAALKEAEAGSEEGIVSTIPAREE